MKLLCSLNPLSRAGAVLLAAGAAAPALAQDCRLSVSASDHVLMAGETAGIDVWGHFPAAAFALASAEFDVRASRAGWSRSTSRR